MTDDDRGRSTLGDRFAAGWRAFWFRPELPTNLAVARFVFFIGLCWWQYLRLPALTVDDFDYTTWPEALHWPISVFEYLPTASPSTLLVLHRILELTLVLAAIGFATRLTTVMVGVLMFYLGSLESMNGKMFFLGAVPIILTGLFALSRAGDALSADRLIRGRLAWWPFGTTGPLEPHAAYRWPMQICRVYIVIVYFSAGVAKLRFGGLGWALSDNLGLLFSATQDNQKCIFSNPILPDLTHWLAHHSAVTRLLGVGTVVIELAAPLALRASWIGYACVAAMIMMNFGFYYVLGADFRPLVLADICFFIPWTRLGGWLRHITTGKLPAAG